MRRPAAVLLLPLVAALVSCTANGSSDDRPPSHSASTPSSVPVSACQTSTVQHGKLPATFTKYIQQYPNWIGNDKATAVLFYATGEDSTIGTSGANGPQMKSKILWLVDGKPDGPLTLNATNLTTGTRLIQGFEGGGNFPSIPVLPDAGCWHIDAKLAHKTVLTVVLIAKDMA